MKKLFILLTIISSISAKEVNFDEALNLLFENNKELKYKKLNIEDKKTFLAEISASNYGKLNFKEIYTNTNHSGYVFNSKLSSRDATFSDFGLASYTGPSSLNIKPHDLNYPNYRDNFETKITYEIPLFTGFKISVSKDISELQIKAEKAKYKYDKKLLSLELLKSYNASVASKEYIGALNKSKEVTQSFLNYATELNKEGLVTKIDVKQALVRDLNINAKLKDAQNKYDLSIAYLNFLTSANDITGVKNFALLKGEDIDLIKMKDIAINRREDLTYLKLNTQSIKNNIKIEKASYYPQIGAYFEYGYNNETIKSFNSNEGFYLATIALNYKLFDFKREAKIQRSKIQYNKIKLQQEHMRDTIKLEVKENLLNFQSKQEVLIEKNKAKELAKDILYQSQEMYKNHLITMTNLLTQEGFLEKARADVIMSKYELTFAIAKLKISLGKSLKE